MPVFFMPENLIPNMQNLLIFLVSELQTCPKSIHNVSNNVHNKLIRKQKLTQVAQQSHKKPTLIFVCKTIYISYPVKRNGVDTVVVEGIISRI